MQKASLEKIFLVELFNFKPNKRLLRLIDVNAKGWEVWHWNNC